MNKATFIKTAFLLCALGMFTAGCDTQSKPVDKQTEPPKTNDVRSHNPGQDSYNQQ